MDSTAWIDLAGEDRRFYTCGMDGDLDEDWSWMNDTVESCHG